MQKIIRSKYFFLLASFVLLQAAMFLIATPNHFFKNIGWYYDIAYHLRDVGLFTLWTPYPPLFAVFFYFFGILFSDRESFSLAWQMLNLALVVANGFVIHRITARYGKSTARLAAFGYILINFSITSGISMGYYFDQYDYIPILMMLGALYLLMRAKPALAGSAREITASAVLGAIGALTKLFPGLVLLVAMLTLDNRRRIQYAVIFAATCALILLPWLVINPNSLVSFLNFSGSRDAWETIWHFPVMKFPPIPNPKSFTRPFEAEPNNSYNWLTALTILALLGSLWQHRYAKAPHDMARAMLSFLLAIFIFSKGFSSYFIFWIFPVLFIIYQPLTAFLLCAAFLLVGDIEFFGSPPAQFIPHWVAIFGRHALLIGLWIESLFEKPLERVCKSWLNNENARVTEQVQK